MVHRVPEKKIVSVNFSCAMFSLLVFLTLEAGTNRLTQNISKGLGLAPHVWFRTIQFGTVRFGASYANLG